MFSTSLRGGKAFAAEQKIRELKARISKLKGQKLKITSNKIIEISTKNMNIQPSKKYGISPDEVESRALKSEKIRTLFNMHRIEKTGKLNIRMERYDEKKILKKKKKPTRRFKNRQSSIFTSGQSKEKKRTRYILQAICTKYQLL